MRSRSTRKARRIAAATCLVAFGLATVVVPFLHERVHEHEAEADRGAPTVHHDEGEDLHHRPRPHRHDRAHGDPHERTATRPPEPRHHHHHHEGDDSDPLQHGADAPEHLEIALLVAQPALPLPPPRAALQPAPPLARAGCLPRTLARPNATRGPPAAGDPISIAAS